MKLTSAPAPPDTVYREPATPFVAGFIGSPAMNFLKGKLKVTLLGERELEDDSIELKKLKTGAQERVSLDSVVEEVRLLVAELEQGV